MNEELEKPIRIFKSSITDDSIELYKQRFGKSSKKLVGFWTICLIIFLSSLAVIMILSFVIIGFLIFAGLSLVGIILINGGIYYFFIIKKKDFKEESNYYFIEIYMDRMILNSKITSQKTIEYSKIIRIKKFNQESKKFKSEDIDAHLEHMDNPYFHPATNDDNLYSIIIYENDSNGKKSENQYVVDLADFESFIKNVLNQDQNKITRTIQCPKCKSEFKHKKETSQIQCPTCGIKGSL